MRTTLLSSVPGSPEMLTSRRQQSDPLCTSIYFASSLQASETRSGATLLHAPCACALVRASGNRKRSLCIRIASFKTCCWSRKGNDREACFCSPVHDQPPLRQWLASAGVPPDQLKVLCKTHGSEKELLEAEARRIDLHNARLRAGYVGFLHIVCGGAAYRWDKLQSIWS